MTTKALDRYACEDTLMHLVKTLRQRGTLFPGELRRDDNAPSKGVTAPIDVRRQTHAVSALLTVPRASSALASPVGFVIADCDAVEHCVHKALRFRQHSVPR